MKRILPFILALTLIPSLRAADQPIDPERARELFQRAQAGEKLSEDEQKYLDEAKRQRERGVVDRVTGPPDALRSHSVASVSL